ncbi:MAG: ROK family protein [Planctomycetes bacterium]|nr:ROK family protein [Planctomycetota bacterium]
MKTATQKENAILGFLFHHGPATRAQLADALGLRRNTVGDLCAGLLMSNSIQEMDSNKQRNVRLALNPDIMWAVGVRHLPEGFRVILMDAACAIRFDADIPAAGATGVARCELLGREIVRILSGVQAPRDRILGIGLADMAIVDPKSGRSLRSAHISGWNNIHTCEIIERETGLKTWLPGFTDAAAVMEVRAIPAPGWKTILCLWLNQAIGLSVFLNGETARGNHPVSGEIGHVVVEPNGGICRCGNRGCLETVASTGAILQRVSHGITRGAEFMTTGEDITLDDVIANANAGNKLALRVLDDAGRAVGRALAIAVNMFGISNVLLMGRLTEAGDVFLAPIKEAVRRDCVAPINTDVSYRVVGKPSAGVAAGAAYLAFHWHFREKTGKSRELS